MSKFVLMASSCTETKDVPKSFGILEIGIAEADTAYRVYFKSLATGIENIYDITSDAEGRLLIQRVADEVQLAGGWYEIAAVLSTRYYINEDATIAIDGTNYTCFLTRFVDVIDAAGDQESYSYIKLQAA